jgi:hypothetical protein
MIVSLLPLFSFLLLYKLAHDYMLNRMLTEPPVAPRAAEIEPDPSTPTP